MARSKTKPKSLQVVVRNDNALGRYVADKSGKIFASKIVLNTGLADVQVSSKTEPVVVLLTHPIEALADQISQTDVPSAALADWKDAASEMLASARRMRRQLIIVDARAVLHKRPKAIASLGSHIGKTMPAAPDQPDTNDVVFADAILTNDSAARGLIAELDALRQGEVVSLLNADVLDEAYQAGGSAAKAALAEMAQERELLRENVAQQLKNVQQGALQHEQLLADITALEKTAANRHLLRAENDAMQRRIETLQEAFAGREAMLSATLLEDQKDMARAQADIADLNDRLNQMSDELDQVYGSSSWRVTRPLRSAKSLVRPSK